LVLTVGSNLSCAWCLRVRNPKVNFMKITHSPPQPVTLPYVKNDDFTSIQLAKSKQYRPVLFYYPKRKMDYQQFQFDNYGVHCAKPLSFSYELLKRLPKEVTDSISTILDPCSSIGNCAIGFALAGKKVIASDLSEKRIEIAKRNAFEICKLKSKEITFEVKDAIEAIKNTNADTIFLDPPYGNSEKRKGPYFTLEHLGKKSTDILREALNTDKMVILTLPKKTDINELRSLVQDPQFSKTRDISIHWVRTNQYSKYEFSTIVFYKPSETPVISVKPLSLEQ
jgi:predicted RNA methylase